MSSLEAPDNKNLELVISDRDMKRMQRVGKENADLISIKNASDIFWQENSLVRLWTLGANLPDYRADHPKQQMVSNKPDLFLEFLGPSCGEGTGLGWELESSSKVKKRQKFLTTKLQPTRSLTQKGRPAVQV